MKLFREKNNLTYLTASIEQLVNLNNRDFYVTHICLMALSDNLSKY